MRKLFLAAIVASTATAAPTAKASLGPPPFLRSDRCTCEALQGAICPPDQIWRPYPCLPWSKWKPAPCFPLPRPLWKELPNPCPCKSPILVQWRE
jgi:hypothetical protein